MENGSLNGVAKCSSTLTENTKDSAHIDTGNLPFFSLGDLLFAKIGKYPFWPCMVSYEPETGLYYKSSYNNFKYHVQYFGKSVQRGWTSAGGLIPFEGEKRYNEFVEELTKQASTKIARKTVKLRYLIQTRFKKKWLFAVKEAEDALNFERDLRYETFVFKYEKNEANSKKSSSSKKRKMLNLTESSKKQRSMDALQICKMCDKDDTNIICSGPCSQSFHLLCIGLLNVLSDFKCLDCLKGVYLCFLCKKYETFLSKCQYGKCNKYYHDICMESFDRNLWKKKSCPLHSCFLCLKHSRSTAYKGEIVQCFKCPIAFHSKCIPSGSEVLNSSYILCPDHFVGKNKVSPQPIVNFTYCSLCSSGGDLICCESCPRTYHASCLDNEVPSGDFICEHCMKKEHLYSGMIVWGKTSVYRWWPAVIMSYEELPNNIKALKHYPGEFPIKYFGTNEYFWTHRGRVIQYSELQREFRFAKNKMDENFIRGLDEANAAYKQYLEDNQKRAGMKPEPYKHIKVNRAVPPAQVYTVDIKSLLPCSCDPEKPHPCSADSFCLNRSMMIECHPDLCKAKDLCENQKFQRRQYAEVKIIKTDGRGFGLQTLQFIKKGDFVIEYVGDIITHDEYKRRTELMIASNVQKYYFLYIDSRRMIDAGPRGNLARFINHSCDPNCEMVKWSVNGDLKIGIFAIRDIQPGEELSFHYQSDNIQFDQECHCGAANCQKIIGRRALTNGKNGHSLKNLSHKRN